MITFFSNFINEHQIPFCKAMFAKTNGNFRFVATEPISQERLNMGFVDQSDSFSFVIKSFQSADQHQEAMRLGTESDVVIIGDAPDCFVEERLRQNKLTFRYWERFFKDGRWHILDPRVLIAHYKQDFRYRKKNLYMLCASAYTAPDCRFIHSYPNKTYRWGYFPEVKKYEDIDSLIANKKKATILWTARFINWKHPEAPIKVAERLKKEGYRFTLNLIGGGALEARIRSMIQQKGLADCVHLLGTMSPDEVRRHMEESEIFLFTSDRNEGWGAVLNESMNSGCAVVASRAIGSVPYLLCDGENGLIFKDGDWDDLYGKVKFCMDYPRERVALGKSAYETLNNVWNADIAAKRFLTLVESIRKGKETPFSEGPCSKD